MGSVICSFFPSIPYTPPLSPVLFPSLLPTPPLLRNVVSFFLIYFAEIPYADCVLFSFPFFARISCSIYFDFRFFPLFSTHDGWRPDILGACSVRQTKIVYVASLNDQVVPIYSGLFTAVSHPLILRALYIDGDAYQ